MPSADPTPVPLSKPQARRLWLRAQRLDVAAPFGAGPAATRAAVEHLGYVQIDTINVMAWLVALTLLALFIAARGWHLFVF